MPHPRHGESKESFVSRCMGSDEAQSDFPDEKQRAAFCHSRFEEGPAKEGERTEYDGEAKNKKDEEDAYQFFAGEAIKTATCAARREKFLGRSFRVVPAVLVRSQVLRNNLGTTFLPGEEITDDWAALWNNVPVLVGAHPSLNGIPSSGRTPEIMNSRWVGFIFNARVDTKNGIRRLVGEVWLDESRADVPGYADVLKQIDAGKVVELSTGFPTLTSTKAGSFMGTSYDMVLTPAGADHLVVSLEMTGACAVADGCGLGANSKVEGDKMISVAQVKKELQARFGSESRTVVVGNVNAADNWVAFWYDTAAGREPKEDEYLRAGFNTAGGAMNFSEPTHMRRIVKDEPVAPLPAPVQQSNKGEDKMADQEKGKDQLAELSGIVTNLAETVKKLTEKVEAVANTGAPAELAGLKKTMAELNAKFEKMATVTTAAITERERERQALVKELAGNFRCSFGAAELEGKPIEELRKLAEMVKPENWAGRGGSGGAGVQNEAQFAEPIPYWKRDKKEGE